MTFGLTPVQKNALDAIRSHVADTGATPTVRELAQRLGHKSPSSAHPLLAELQDRGHIRRLDHRKSAIEIIGTPPTLRGPIVTSIALSRLPTDTLITELMRRGYDCTIRGVA